MLSGFFGINEGDKMEPKKIDDVRLSKPEFDVSKLSKLLQRSRVSDEKYDRILHSVGRSYKNLLKLRYYGVEKVPDAVVYAGGKKDILHLIEFCEKEGIACVPFGGGTSVVGGVDVQGIEKPVISLDMTELSELVSVDKKSRIARVQVGVRGPELENKLREFGLALRHYPQSFHFSTLGGWIATRSAGHFSSRYGKIEDMVQSIEVITPRGIVETFDVPSSACGPDIVRLFAGSEGILGVIVEAVIRCHLVPQKKLSTSFEFGDFYSACESARTIIQHGIFPPLMRILDEREYMLSSLLSGGKYDGGALFILGFEADEENYEVVEKEFDFARKICVRMGGKNEGVKKFEEWKKEYFEQPYLRDFLMDFSLVVDTLETATVWSNLMNLYWRVREAIESEVFSESMGGVSCRITHVYESGASLYFSFFAKAKRGEEEALWWKIKKSASDAISSAGGTISHHHGVGRDHKIWAEKELHGTMFLMKGMKKLLDPSGIMNPGAVFDIDF